MTRTDSHRPSVLDPADYEEIGYVDMHPEEGGMWIDPEHRHTPFFEGNATRRAACDHCGNRIRYGVFFYHRPSGEIVTVGEQCAAILDLASKTEREYKQLRERIQRETARNNWLAASDDNIAAYEFLTAAVEAGNWGYKGFYHDLLHKLNRYGSLSEKQVAAALRGRDRDAEQQARRAAEAEALADVAPLAEGRYEITGEIVSTKWQDSDFGGTMKMLVKLADGNKVWGTVPESLYCHDVHDGLPGMTVSFKATVTRSDRDEHFGFFKRPSNATATDGRQ